MTTDTEALCTALDDEGAHVMLVCGRQRVVRWASSACAQLDSQFRTGAPVDDAGAIAALLAGLPGGAGTSTRQLQRQLHWDGNGDDCDDDRSDDTSAIPVICQRIDGDLVLLRFRCHSRLDEYYRRYLAEREQLFTTSRALTVGEMATTLAHELNQPIGTTVNMLDGCITRLQRREDIDPAVLDALAVARRQSQYAAQVIARIRDFAEARRPAIDITDVRALIEDAVEVLDWFVHSERVSVHVSVEASGLYVSCDPTLLQQVIVNVCRNGIEAMRDNPPGERALRIHARSDEDGIAIDVIDCGHGIGGDGDSVDKTPDAFFTPFNSRKPGGMGVGLSICRSFVELHQGRFWITANAHAGCTAHILLPEWRDKGSTRSDSGEQHARPVPGSVVT